MQRTAEFGNPMYLFGKVLNALMLSPIEADVARMHFINDILDAGQDVYGEDFLARLNQQLRIDGDRTIAEVSVGIREALEVRV